MMQWALPALTVGAARGADGRGRRPLDLPRRASACGHGPFASCRIAGPANNGGMAAFAATIMAPTHDVGCRSHHG
ncbi:hypothetical protein [Paracoccus sp. Ld10]|uniref:hypothetical protein n=1 Tax=Paracoccus sp. Ld10 TaxID=649158 RepID=UPI003863C3BA